MLTVLIYTKKTCSYCDHAKKLLNEKKISFQEIAVDIDSEKRAEMEKLSGRRTVPQIFINGKSIGGYDDLSALAQSGQLDILLNH